MIWTKEQAKALTDRALAFSKAEETQVVLTGGDRANVRFARNSVTTSGASSGYSLAIAAKFGKKTGTVTASEFSDASLQRAARNAEEIARLSPDNPEAMPLLGPQTYATVKSYFDDAAGATPEWRAGAVRAALDAATEKKVEAAGFVETSAQIQAVAHVERAVRLRPLHRGRLQPDGAHAGRHRLRLGVEVVQRAAPAAAGRARGRGDRQGGDGRTARRPSSPASTRSSSSRRRWPT